MGQGECLEVLKQKDNKDRWLSTEEISKLIGKGQSCTAENLRKLRKRKEVRMKEIREGFRRIYAYKIDWRRV